MEARLAKGLRTLLRHEAVGEDVEISLLLCDDPFIQALNVQYRGLDKPTDVLSFGQGEAGESLPTVLGDIVISLPTAARQAEKAGWPLENEVILLAVHGGLHLLGYDDETLAGAAEMQEKTAAVLTDLGIPPPVEGSHPFFVEYP